MVYQTYSSSPPPPQALLSLSAVKRGTLGKIAQSELHARLAQHRRVSKHESIINLTKNLKIHAPKSNDSRYTNGKH